MLPTEVLTQKRTKELDIFILFNTSLANFDVKHSKSFVGNEN